MDHLQHAKVRPGSVIGFGLVHLAALGVLFVGFSWTGVFLVIASYYLRMFALTAGFHRYFSHKTYKLNRFWQFAMAFLGQTAAQKGVLWWAAHHRNHHKYADQPPDVHSPVQYGFWWSHMGWILSADSENPDYGYIPDLVKYPELRWLDRNQYFATIIYAVALTLAFGPVGLFYGYFLSTVLLWHGTFSINSIMHVFGKRVFDTTDDSRNSFTFAVITMGEGWHNNHHFYPGSAAQGFRWWQVDFSYYVLFALEKLGIVRDLRRAPKDAEIERAVRSSASRVNDAVSAAGDRMAEQIAALTASWNAMRGSVQLAANNALGDLEARRVKLSEQIEELQREYADARARAGGAALRRRQELKGEIESYRAQLAATLEQLVSSVPQRA
jgi:stearoyl-CoA desaturase (Delta-9 desaturase)